MIARLIGTFLALLTTPAVAQDYGPDYDPAVLSGCLASPAGYNNPAVCIGMAASHCMEGEAGQSTVGVGYCFSSEWEDWDARLNAAYAEARANAAAADADMVEFNERLAGSEQALIDQQRAWITWRDLACTYEASRWGGGTGGGPASAQCLMQLTAQQTLFLWDRLQ